MLRKALLCALLAAAPLPVACAGERETGDYNFDGHEDYRVFRESNGKAHYYDYFLYDSATKKFSRSEALCATFNARFDADSKEIHCSWPGGHSGKIFYREDYAWKGKNLALLRVIKQTNVEFGESAFHYIRVTATINEGKPAIDSIEAVP